MSGEPWVPASLWEACIIPPVRCVQCRRYIPSGEAVEELLRDMETFCDDCFDMQTRSHC